MFVSASENSEAMVGGKYYDSLEEAILNASSKDIVKLISNVGLDETLDINKTVNLDLNGHNISSDSMAFSVQGGVLNITGSGTIRETNPYYGAIFIKGSTDLSDKDYSIVNVGKDVTLEGWSGIFIDHNDSSAYGVVANIEGKINAVDDKDGGTGVGVYVNGNIKHKDNEPVVNIKDGAYITSTGNGLYIAGNSIFNIGKAHISGIESGIGIKAGTLNINGATVICNGEDNTPTDGYNNGIKASGVSLQIESNSGYAGDIKIDIKDGTFKSKNSNVVYEYIGKGNNTTVNSFDIANGNFISEANKDVFALSDSFKSMHSDFISGGKYSSDPSVYLKSGYMASLDNNLYRVAKSTIKEVISSSVSVSNNNGNSLKFIIIFIGVLLLGILGYINRGKIIDIFSK